MELSDIISFCIGVIPGAFLGVIMGRRSTTANETVDRIREEYERKFFSLQPSG